MESSKKFTDENLKGEALEAYTEQFLRAKFDRDRKNRWGKMLAENHGVAPPVRGQAKKKPRILYLWVGAIAAAILLLFIFKPAFMQFSTGGYQQMADNFLQEDFFQNQEISKGELNIEQLKLDAASAYNRRDFSTSIDRYEDLLSSGQAESQHIFFLGLSYLYGKNYPKAIEMLALFLENKDTPGFKQEAQWFLALAYLKNEEPDKARSFLKLVKEGNWNAEKARQLLQAME